MSGEETTYGVAIYRKQDGRYDCFSLREKGASTLPNFDEQLKLLHSSGNIIVGIRRSLPEETARLFRETGKNLSKLMADADPWNLDESLIIIFPDEYSPPSAS